MSNLSIRSQSGNKNTQSQLAKGFQLPAIDDFFNNFTQPWPLMRPNLNIWDRQETNLSPKVDISEDDKNYILSAELPGLDVKDVNLDISDGVLTLSGEKKTEMEDKDENHHIMERSYGYFKRSFSLPASVEEDKITADFKKGVLHICMPKSVNAQQKQRKISIKE
ncbi:MAG: HSP20 family protein [Paraglaciecola sp.]|jgi:HSP20 family protein